MARRVFIFYWNHPWRKTHIQFDVARSGEFGFNPVVQKINSRLAQVFLFLSLNILKGFQHFVSLFILQQKQTAFFKLLVY